MNDSVGFHPRVVQSATRFDRAVVVGPIANAGTDLGIEDNVALVQASSSGFGKACARALAREGATVPIDGGVTRMPL